MTLSEFKEHLEAHPEAELCFLMSDGERIEAHAHITEVGRTDRRFVDCGGAIRSRSACTLQAWVYTDLQHRLLPGALARVIEKSLPLFDGDDLDVEIEYEACSLSQLPVVQARFDGQVLTFLLTEKHADCLAKSVCLKEMVSGSSNCCDNGECC